jgi:hypothetical protein
MGSQKKDARIGAGDPPRRDHTMREAAPCQSIQPGWKIAKAKTKLKNKQTLTPRLTTFIGASSNG